MFKTRVVGLLLCACTVPLGAGPFSVSFGSPYFSGGPKVDLSFNGPNGLKTFVFPAYDLLTETYLGDRGIFVFSGELTADPLAMAVDYFATPCNPCFYGGAAFTPGNVGRLPFREFEVPYPSGYLPRGGSQPSDFGSDANGMLTGMLHATQGGIPGAPSVDIAYTWNIQVNDVPEPAPVLFTGIGIVVMLGLGWKKG